MKRVTKVQLEETISRMQRQIEDLNIRLEEARLWKLPLKTGGMIQFIPLYATNVDVKTETKNIQSLSVFTTTIAWKKTITVEASGMELKP